MAAYGLLGCNILKECLKGVQLVKGRGKGKEGKDGGEGRDNSQIGPY